MCRSTQALQRARKASLSQRLEHGVFSENEHIRGVDALSAGVGVLWVRRTRSGQTHELVDAVRELDVHVERLRVRAPAGGDARVLRAGESGSQNKT
jgi:hypothetical protein